ncbi:MAG: inorganic phosphate transporter [Planctomycetota bacterium]|nr:inorganic phosphate transporter [Planctomycetota bacterium]
MHFFDAIASLPTHTMLCLIMALAVAFAFEFINGFHDTANAVTTVIYTRTLKATPAVLYSGLLNFIGVLLGGTAIAFGIVNLLPVDLLLEHSSNAALVMVLSLLISGVAWNLGTWWFGLPVSSSHTLIGSILGVGVANSLLEGNGLAGVNWHKAAEVGAALLFSPLLGFTLAAAGLALCRLLVPDPELYQPPHDDKPPPRWIRAILILTCGGVSYAHGSNDGQKGMGLVLLVLVGFMPFAYALNTADPTLAERTLKATEDIEAEYQSQGLALSTAQQDDIATIRTMLAGIRSFSELPSEERWLARLAIFRLKKQTDDYLAANEELHGLLYPPVSRLSEAVEYVPLWVMVCTALALGLGTTIGYKRIVVTVAEKIGKTHLTYAQGAVAESVAAGTILLAAFAGVPVSTTHVLSSGVAGTMVANRSGVQAGTLKKIGLAWLFTMPASMLLAALLFFLGRALFL